MKELTLESIGQKYVKAYADYQTKRKELENQIEKAQGKLEALKHPSWVEEIVKPIAKALLKHLPCRYYEILGPFGMGSRTSIHFYKNGVTEKTKFEGRNCLGIEFNPTDLENGRLSIVDYETDTGEFKRGTIREMHGFNHPLIEIEPTAKIKDLLKWVR